MKLFEIRILDRKGKALRRAFAQGWRKGHAVAEAVNLMALVPGAARFVVAEA